MLKRIKTEHKLYTNESVATFVSIFIALGALITSLNKGSQLYLFFVICLAILVVLKFRVFSSRGEKLNTAIFYIEQALKETKPREEYKEKNMENLIEDISEAKGVLIGEIVLVIAWFYYLGHLDKLNEKLKEYYSSSDGAVVRAFKIVFSEQNSSIMGYLLGGLVLLALLIGVVVVLFKQGNISVALITGILNLILMLFVFKSLLAPILVSIIILLVVVAIVMFCFHN